MMWEKKSLGVIADVYNGNSINADYKKKHFLGLAEGLPFIATKDVLSNGEIDYENGVKVPLDAGLKIAPADSVFVCAEGGSAGKKIAFVKEDVCFGNKLFCIHPKKKELYSAKYIYYFCRSELFREQFFGELTGLIGGVSAKKFRSIECPIPPLPEQERIVSLLDAQFAKIDAIKANAEKQLQDAKALFQSALKDLLTPKEGWRCCKLSEIGQSKIGPFGSLLHKKDYITGGIPLINPMHIKNGLICEDFNFSISIEKRNELLNYVLQEFDIILGRRGEMGRCAVVSEREKGWLCGTGSIIFRPDIKIVSPYFLQLSISTPRNVKKLEKLAGGATMLNLSSSGLNQLELDLPALKEQYEIVEVLEEIKSKIQSLQSNYDQTITLCNDLKQSILKDIFG